MFSISILFSSKIYSILDLISTYKVYVIIDIIGNGSFTSITISCLNNSVFYFLSCPHSTILLSGIGIGSKCIVPVSSDTGPVTLYTGPVTRV